MVRVLAVADEEAPMLHVTGRRLAPEVILAAGDLPWHYLELLSSAIDVPVVFVPGNHDPRVETPPGRLLGGASGSYAEAPRPHGCLNADLRVVEIAGLRIAGLGGCVRYKPGPNMYTQDQYRRRARRLIRQARAGRDVDVLLTHAPPRGLGDGDDAPHHGIDVLHHVLDVLAPPWHLHGHIHPYGRAMPDRQVGPTTVRNVIPWKVIEITPAVGVGAPAPRY